MRSEVGAPKSGVLHYAQDDEHCASTPMAHSFAIRRSKRLQQWGRETVCMPDWACCETTLGWLPSGAPPALPFWVLTPLLSPILSPQLPSLPIAVRNGAGLRPATSSSPPALPPDTGPLGGSLGGGCSVLCDLAAPWPENRRRAGEDGASGIYSSRGVHSCKKLCNRTPDGRDAVGSIPRPILQPCRGWRLLGPSPPLPPPLPPHPAFLPSLPCCAEHS